LIEHLLCVVDPEKSPWILRAATRWRSHDRERASSLRGGRTGGGGFSVILGPIVRHRGSLMGAGEARLVTIACSEPPTGRARWTMQLLAD